MRRIAATWWSTVRRETKEPAPRRGGDRRVRLGERLELRGPLEEIGGKRDGCQDLGDYELRPEMVAAGRPVAQPSRGTLGRRETGCAGSGGVIALSGLGPWPTCLAAPSRFSSPTSRARPRWSSSSETGTTRCSATHQRLLREAFAHHGGHEVDTQGDSFFVAFASARDAVLAAVEGQRALAAHAWPDGAAVKVRMGIHTGQASPADGRYTGIAVHRAARIGAAGHGGQVLVSQATQTLLEDEEEDLGIALRISARSRSKTSIARSISTRWPRRVCRPSSPAHGEWRTRRPWRWTRPRPACAPLVHDCRRRRLLW